LLARSRNVSRPSARAGDELTSAWPRTWAPTSGGHSRRICTARFTLSAWKSSAICARAIRRIGGTTCWRGLDLPEVAMVAIPTRKRRDFCAVNTSLIQRSGEPRRKWIPGSFSMPDSITAHEKAMDETTRGGRCRRNKPRTQHPPTTIEERFAAALGKPSSKPATPFATRCTK